MVVGTFEMDIDTVVIGAGPGGYVAAIRLSQLGQKVVIVEKNKIGGVCLNVGCIPSKALIHSSEEYYKIKNNSVMGVTSENVNFDFEAVQNWKDNKVVSTLTKGIEALLKKNKVEIVEGEAYFINNKQLQVMNEQGNKKFNFKNAVIATGSRPLEIKGFKFSGRVLDSTGLLNLKSIPSSLVIIGGGYIGSELAGVYANLGTKVTILEGADNIIPNFDADMVEVVKGNLKARGVEIVTKALAVSSKQDDNGVTVEYKVGDDTHNITADYVMVSVGRTPNIEELGLDNAGVEVGERKLISVDDKCQTNVEGIYAIGDVSPGLALAHKASYEAKVVAAVISGENAKIDYKAIPAVCFTNPEMASVGYTQKEAKDKKLNVKVSKFPFAANGRSLTMESTQGFIRIIHDKDTHEIVGAQIVGKGASDIISELTLAIECGLTIEDISLTIHSHPSLGEAIMDCTELAEGYPIHV